MDWQTPGCEGTRSEAAGSGWPNWPLALEISVARAVDPSDRRRSSPARSVGPSRGGAKPRYGRNLLLEEAPVGCSEVISSWWARLPSLAANDNAPSHFKDSPAQRSWGGESFHAFRTLRPVPASY